MTCWQLLKSESLIEGLMCERDSGGSKKLRNVAAWVLAVLALLVVATISFTIGWRPFIGPRSRTLTARKFDSTPARLVRGAYLAHNLPVRLTRIRFP
jgi:hypothetical protein